MTDLRRPFTGEQIKSHPNFTLSRLVDFSPFLGLKRSTLREAIKGRIADFNVFLRENHRSGAGGIRTVRLNTEFFDSLICFLYKYASENYYSRYPRLDFPLAVVAVGGYGRKDMCPQSDIDLLFLFHFKVTPFVEAVTEDMLYTMWDLGLPVGHSVRSVNEAISYAESDHSIRTALIDYRFVCGNEAFFLESKETLNKFLFFFKGDRYIEERISDLRERHDKYGDVVYLLEPNIKEGKGGLRDLHTALWALKVKYKSNDLHELFTKGVLTKRSEKNYYFILDRLLRIRNEVHFLKGRKDDTVTFDIQKELSRFWGYRDHGIFLGTERFMRYYYILSTLSSQLSEEIIEEVQRFLPDKGWKRFFVRGGRHGGGGDFAIYRGKVHVNSSRVLVREPSKFFQVFAYSQDTGCPLSSQAKRRLKKTLNIVDSNFRKDEHISSLFRSILKKGRNLRSVLMDMNETRFLGKYIPEFAHLFFRAQQDIYHRFTVDVHSVMAATLMPSKIEARERGESLDEESQRFLELYETIEDKPLFLLSVLFHDIGKGLGHGHSKIGKSLVGGILKRMGFEEDAIEDCRFLVEYHLEMANISQRRDMHDIEMIHNFAMNVGSVKRLDMLYLLTYCDMKCVSEESWNRWRAMLIKELYEKARNILEQGEFKLPPFHEILQERKESIRNSLSKYPDADVDRYLSEMPDRYFIATSSERFFDHFSYYSRFEGKPLVDMTEFPEKKCSELLVVCGDSHALFSKISGVIAAHNINILGANVATSSRGIAVDTFQVTHLGDSVKDRNKIDSLKADLVSMVEGTVRVESLLERRAAEAVRREKVLKYRPTRVNLDNVTSRHYTIVDIFTYDRVGLLYDITRTISRLGYEIYLSKISTKADQVADVFYIADWSGRKIDDQNKCEELKKALFSAAEGNEIADGERDEGQIEEL